MSTNTTRTIATVTSVVGGVLMLGLVGGAALSAVFEAGASQLEGGVQTVAVDGVAGLRVESSAAEFSVRFADVQEASLAVEEPVTKTWSLEVRQDRLVVESARPFPGFCFAWCFDRGERVTLTLPEHLNDGSLDAEIEVSAGSLDAEGSFDLLDVSLSAGSVYFDGAARSLNTDVSAGRAELAVDGATEVGFDVSAGRLIAVLTGEAPRTTDVDVSAGNLDITLPDELYDVSSDVSAGSLDNQLETSSRSEHRISVSVSAGSATLRPGR